MVYAIARLETGYQPVYDYVSRSNAQLNLTAIYKDFFYTLYCCGSYYLYFLLNYYSYSYYS